MVAINFLHISKLAPVVKIRKWFEIGANLCRFWLKFSSADRFKHMCRQGGRTWQAFGGGKNGDETLRQARIYNFRDKCVVFVRNLKFSNLTQ